ncbi:MAG TPA: hypothetical protein VFF30_11325 [Nitrososphaerales archaeon]|nr:hypothetical protein [Nitrososphaerales archaeon]
MSLTLEISDDELETSASLRRERTIPDYDALISSWLDSQKSTVTATKYQSALGILCGTRDRTTWAKMLRLTEQNPQFMTGKLID